MVAVPADDGMYFTEQESLFFESLQVAEAGENLPKPLLDQVTVPVNGLEPITAAVQVVGLPTTVGSVQVTVTATTVTGTVVVAVLPSESVTFTQ